MLSTLPLMVLQALLFPALYAVLKIAAGLLIVHYGKRYAERIKNEER